MEYRTDTNTNKGSPELTLLVFAFMAVFAYVLF